MKPISPFFFPRFPHLLPGLKWKRQESVSSAGAAAPKGGQRSLGRPGVLCESPITGVDAPNQGVPSGSLEDGSPRWSERGFKLMWKSHRIKISWCYIQVYPSTLPRSYWTQNRLVPKMCFFFQSPINPGFVWGCFIWIGHEMKLDVAKPWGNPVSKLKGCWGLINSFDLYPAKLGLSSARAEFFQGQPRWSRKNHQILSWLAGTYRPGISNTASDIPSHVWWQRWKLRMAKTFSESGREEGSCHGEWSTSQEDSDTE